MSGHYNLKGKLARPSKQEQQKKADSPFSLDQGNPFMQGKLTPPVRVTEADLFRHSQMSDQ